MRAKCLRGHSIPTADLNLDQGVALCRVCQTLHTVDELGVNRRTLDAIAAVTQPPPAGCERISLADETCLTASARWLRAGMAALAFGLCWTGFFVYQMHSEFQNVLAAMWGSQVPSDPMTKWMMAGGHLLFLLFLVPFVLVGVALLGASVVMFAGRVEVRLRPDAGRVLSGVWRIGRVRRFDPRLVSDVRVQEHITSGEDGPSRHYTIRLIVDSKHLDFGRILPQPQFNWLAGCMRAELLPDDEPTTPAPS